MIFYKFPDWVVKAWTGESFFSVWFTAGYLLDQSIATCNCFLNHWNLEVHLPVNIFLADVDCPPSHLSLYSTGL